MVSAIGIGFAGEDDRPEAARLVFASAVPLLGRWVGTVLAFYFARENLQAASESQLALTESTMSLVTRVAPTTSVNSVMIPVARIDPKELVADDQAARALKLQDLYTRVRETGRSRVPIFDANHVALDVVHEPDIDK